MGTGSPPVWSFQLHFHFKEADKGNGGIPENVEIISDLFIFRHSGFAEHPQDITVASCTDSLRGSSIYGAEPQASWKHKLMFGLCTSLLFVVKL